MSTGGREVPDGGKAEAGKGAHGDAATERDSFERACQYGGSKVLGLCAGLAASYLDGELVEPVPGRGHALFEFACGKLVNHPACKR